MPNVTPPFSQAVEAAKLQAAEIEDYARNNVGLTLAGWKSKAVELATLILSAPAPSRDPVTAEKCRAFVDRLIKAARRLPIGSGGPFGEVSDEFTAELLAMFAGGTGDVQAMAQEIVDAFDGPNAVDGGSYWYATKANYLARAILGIPSNTAKGGIANVLQDG